MLALLNFYKDKARPDVVVGVPRRIVTIAVEQGNVAPIVPVATGVQNRLQANTLKFQKTILQGLRTPAPPN